MECTLKVKRGNATKTPANPHQELKIPVESCDQAALTNQPSATPPTAAHYEANRIHDAANT